MPAHTTTIAPSNRYIRQTHPTTPIVMVEDTYAGSAWINAGENTTQVEKRAELRAAYDAAVSGGDKHIHYVNASLL
jgi:hypothetical protein